VAFCVNGVLAIQRRPEAIDEQREKAEFAGYFSKQRP
jgi:hypothetical protein